MKSEHRHELKSNELAEWLNNFPQWCRENLSTIIGVITIIVVAGVIYGWRYYSRNVVQAGQEIEFTNQVGNILNVGTKIMEQRMEGNAGDLSYRFIDQAKDMESFAEGVKNNNSAALALLKQADATRAKLHYSPTTISSDELTEQINKARVLYAEVIKKSPSDNAIRGLASLGLGYCAEEINDFDQARQIYNDIVNDDDFIGTVVIAKAKHRLNTMDDYRKDIVFQPMPEIIEPEIIPFDVNEISDANSPVITEISLPESNLPMIDNIPMDLNLPAENDLPVDNNQPAESVIPLEIDMPMEINPSADINQETFVGTDSEEAIIIDSESDVAPKDSDVNDSVE